MAQPQLRTVQLDHVDEINQAMGRLKGFAALNYAAIESRRINVLDYEAEGNIAHLLEFLIDDLEQKLNPIVENHSGE